MQEPIHSRVFTLRADQDNKQTLTSLKALASEPRLRILNLLDQRLCSISEIADELNMHISTATLHVNILEKAGLLITEHKPATRGVQRVCARVYHNVDVRLKHGYPTLQEVIEYQMPIGSFVDCQVTPTCGLVGATGLIGAFDDPASFYEPNRHQAHLLWFHQGFVEYRFPNRLQPSARLEGLQLSLELCSEAPLHHDDWPSDITVWINQVELGSWTSPADFGERRGRLTPNWWASHNTQYGLLKTWQVTHVGSFVDGKEISKVKLKDLHPMNSGFISVKIGVKDGARHTGGINIFGHMFGNYPQDILLRLHYKP